MTRRIYLDSCCLCRPFDDPAADRIRLEAEAVLTILRHVHLGEWELVASDALLVETGAVTPEDKKARVDALVSIQTRFVHVTEAEDARMSHLHSSFGFSPMDALHIACAESARCDILLTTDDRFRKKARRHAGTLKVRVENPLLWLQEQFTDVDDRNDA